MDYETSDNSHKFLWNDIQAAEMHDSLKNTNKAEAIETEQGEAEPDIKLASTLYGLSMISKFPQTSTHTPKYQHAWSLQLWHEGDYLPSPASQKYHQANNPLGVANLGKLSRM
jgi:hypothetical protein